MLLIKIMEVSLKYSYKDNLKESNALNNNYFYQEKEVEFGKKGNDNYSKKDEENNKNFLDTMFDVLEEACEKKSLKSSSNKKKK